MLRSPTEFDPYAVLQVMPTADAVVIQAAFRALARKYHPDRDQTRRGALKMAELNRAYAMLRDGDDRATYDRTRRSTAPGFTPPTSASHGMPSAGVSPNGIAARGAGTKRGSVLDFGRYRGWSLRDLARQDTDYLLWLSRHSSGVRYRTEIYDILRTIGVSAA